MLVLYDIDMPLKDAKKAMTYHFRKYAKVEDERYGVFFTALIIFITSMIIEGRNQFCLPKVIWSWKRLCCNGSKSRMYCDYSKYDLVLFV